MLHRPLCGSPRRDYRLRDGVQPRDDTFAAFAELVVRSLVVRHFPDGVDRKAAHGQILLHAIFAVSVVSSDVRNGDGSVEEPDIGVHERVDLRGADVGRELDDGLDRLSVELRGWGEAGLGEGLLRECGAEPVAEGSGEVRHHVRADALRGFRAEEAREHPHLLRGLVKAEAILAEGDLGAQVLLCPGRVVVNGELHG